MVEVIPGILEQSYPSIVEKLRLVEAYVKWTHIDILDGSLFNNVCFHNPSTFEDLRTPVFLELHMMIANPQLTVSQWSRAGIRRFIGHAEGIKDIESFITTVRNDKKEVGLAIDIDTPVSVITPFLPNIDCVLVMTIHTGRSGQIFEERALMKIMQVKLLAPNLPIEVDGGINYETAQRAVHSGATRLVSTSYLYSAPSLLSALHKLQSL